MRKDGPGLCRWKMKKLSYDERKANLVARLKAVNEEGDDE